MMRARNLRGFTKNFVERRSRMHSSDVPNDLRETRSTVLDFLHPCPLVIAYVSIQGQTGLTASPHKKGKFQLHDECTHVSG